MKQSFCSSYIASDCLFEWMWI